MTAFNAVRFKVKPGRDEEFLEAHRKVDRSWPGMRSANLIKTGDQSYCIIGEWDDMDSMAAARPDMIATLDYVPRHARGARRRQCDRSGVGSCGSGAE